VSYAEKSGNVTRMTSKLGQRIVIFDGDVFTFDCQQLGRPGAARAVGAANGSNPISIVVPCHRVIGRNGTMTGYAGGVQRKEWLLRHEGYLLL
jgi:O-6-methylguanine DNA methyltransferase